MVDPEKYPESNIFVNIRNLTTYKALEKAESAATTLRLTEFYTDPGIIGALGIDINFDLPHLKAIHRHLFQDIYSWAGEIRSYSMALSGDIFTPPDEIEKYIAFVSQEIKHDNYLHGLDRDGVVKKTARYLGLLGMIHPFPEGNGRTQRAFLWQLTQKTGYTLRWEQVHRWENTATAQNVHRLSDYSGMERMIDRVLTPE